MKVAEVDRWIFSTLIYDMLRRPTVYQAQWVAHHTDLILRCAKEYDDRNLNKLADIRTYYEAKPPGSPSPIRTPLHPKTPAKKINLKATALLQFFESTITPTTRLKRAARAKARADKRKEDEKRRKSKSKERPKSQRDMHTFCKTQEHRNEDGEVALS
jgi:hypothetical protein